MPTTQTILDDLARTGIALLLREPFYAHLFGGINKEVVGGEHEVQTLAVGVGSAGTYTLFVNADFWTKELTLPAHREGVVKHEMLHLVFRHLLVREPALDPTLLNIAFDLVVNQYVDRAHLPDDSIFLESFPELHLPQGQTWYFYYRQIEQMRKGEGGSRSGRERSEEMLQSIRADSHGLERHQPWRDVRSRSEMENAVLDTHLDSLLRTAHRRTSAPAWGSLPAGVQEALAALLQPPVPTLNWRAALRAFTTSARSTRLRNTLRRPSKRYGTSPGIRISRRQRVLVAVDTSGSIGAAELQLFFNEIRHLHRAGAQVEVVECDTEIQRRYPFTGQIPTLVQGRGGTDFTAPLALANREHPDALIYLTDGYAGRTQVQPHVPMLWLIAPDGIQPLHPAWRELPGRKVKMGG
jgi:predicted metal-dependent peptidase